MDFHVHIYCYCFFKAVIENQMGKTELVSQVTVMGKLLLR